MNRSSKLSTGTLRVSRRRETNCSVSTACSPGLTAHRQRLADDDAFRLVLANELGEPRETVVTPGPFDDAHWTRHRARGIRDSHSGARGAVVESQHLHDPSVDASSLLPIS